jgi:small subunit ribosomal protein S9
VAESTPTPTTAAAGAATATEPLPAYYLGLGRRKTAIARVRVKPNGTGLIKINGGRTLEQYFQREQDRAEAISALEVSGTKGKFDITMNLCGGGYAGQAGAAKLGIARALLKAAPESEPLLRQQGFLTRDAREKERRKYGRRGARASYQFSKR